MGQQQRDAKTNPERSLLGEYPIHTFGLGKAHNPKALYSIADESNGTYSSITENLSSKIIEALAVCLGGLNNVSAVDTVIRIKANGKGKIKANINRIASGGYKCSRKGALWEITVGILYAGEVKDLMVQFELNVQPLDQGDHQMAPLTASGEYKDIPGGDPITIGECATEFSVYARLFTPKDEKPLLPFPIVDHHKVRMNVMTTLVTKFQEKSQDMEERADGDDVKNLAANKLSRMWDRFKQNDESWKKAKENGLDLERIEEDLDAMVSSLKRGLGAGCVYSWVSSNEMQRATTTGMHRTAFLTSKMKAMIHKAQKQSAEDTATLSVAGIPNLAPPAELVSTGKRVVELLEQIAKSLQDQDSKRDRGEPSRDPSHQA